MIMNLICVESRSFSTLPSFSFHSIYTNLAPGPPPQIIVVPAGDGGGAPPPRELLALLYKVTCFQ